MNISKISVNTALSLGGNQGDVVTAFRKARAALEDAGMTGLQTSSLYKTSPVGCVPGTPDFINAVLTGIWHGPIDNLFSLAQKVEILSGRPENHSRYSDRTLDIDIIFFGEFQIDTPLLTIPHPEAANRLFVLVPLEEVAGNWIFPGKDIAVSDFLNPLRNTEEFKSFQSAKLSENF